MYQNCAPVPCTRAQRGRAAEILCRAVSARL